MKTARQLDREITEILARPKQIAPSPRAHATKKQPSKTTASSRSRDKTSDKINIDQLAELLDLPSWDQIDELNQQHYWEMARGAEDEEAQLEGERLAQEEVYGQWYDAVEAAASRLFGEHGLEFHPTGKQGTEARRYALKIVPSKAWNAAADKVRETINGVGEFHFGDLREFLGSGPYTARQAVLSHLPYIRRHPEVYGGSSARQLYEHAWR